MTRNSFNESEPLLHLLTHSVRAAAVDHHLLCSSGRKGGIAQGVSRAAIERAVQGGLVRIVKSPVVRLLPIAGPLCRWSAQDAAPVDIDRLAWRCSRRWKNVPPRTIKVALATPRAARLCCGTPGRIRAFQLDHDLLVANAACFIAWSDPERLKWLVGEDLLRRQPEFAEGKVPDAAMVHPRTGRVVRYVESGGAYDANRIRQFFEHFGADGVPIEIY